MMHPVLKYSKLLFVVMALMLTLQLPAYAAEMVDINRADAETMIANWKGIGEKKARAIISYRKKNGPFKSIDDLLNVKGIGEGLIKKNKRYMSVKGGVRSTAVATTKKSTKKTKSSKTKDAKKSTGKSTGKSTSKKPARKDSSKKSTKKKPKKPVKPKTT